MAPAKDQAVPSASNTTATRNKLIIRRLPPNLPEDIFWQSVSPWITPETCLWKRYVRGKTADSHDGRPIYSRAYVLLSTVDDLIAFHRSFDGHIYKSKTGVEYQAVVEFAPFQKTPHRAKVKADTRQGTIEDDPDYKSFLDSLNAPVEKPVLKPSVPVSQPTTTPLLEHLRVTALAKASKSKKAKGSQQTQEPAKDAALAAVSKAAAKRAPSNAGSVTMIAGKGRGVTITPTSSTDLEAGPSGKASKRNRKGKSGSSNLAGSSVVTEDGNAENGNKGPKPTDAASTAKGRGGARGGGAGGGGGGGGRGRGKSRDDTAVGRSARESVIEVVSRNAERETPRGRGGNRGASRGRGGRPGGSVGTVTAAEARIDM